ncbi:unnamed protein product [Trichobilharzia szidati]|nr:unnamed protein product [Trichobilharzia szidati]
MFLTICLILSTIHVTTNYFVSSDINDELHSDKLIEYINENSLSGWKAVKYDRFKLPTHKLLNSFNLYFDDPNGYFRNAPIVSHDTIKTNIPESFDSRKQWQHCKTMQIITDESRCMSSYALVAAQVITDRICIATNGNSLQISALDILSCCSYCGRGCIGGYYNTPWDYWMRSGVVTGALNNSSGGCKPYPYPKCQHYARDGKYPSCGETLYKVPECAEECQSTYKIEYEDDKNYGRNYYRVDSNESAIQKEIMLNGPVEAAISVYTDFLHYKSGVYKYMKGELLGYKAVRIIGWGVEDNTAYWLCSNSWNEDWGEMGYFRILRGKNESGIEGFILAGIPSI